MISKEILVIQQDYLDLWGARGTPKTPTSWSKGIFADMIEITHGQWMYQNVHVHDTVTWMHSMRRNEEIQKEIVDQIHTGGEGLAEDDKYLLEIHLQDMDTKSGEKKNTGSLAYNLHKRQV